LLWQPLPVALPPAGRITALILGILLYFSGMLFCLWGRLVLGRMYFVSTSMGAQLFTDHRLITYGPFAMVRHPMYLGLSVAAVGGLFLFQTWTMFVFLLLPLGFVRRARVEERVLADAFGEQWQTYCRRVPAWKPRLRSK
jgi:protein-S-isoprenylcysteine O-methyltransferase Ste14